MANILVSLTSPGGLENLQILEQPQLTPKEDEIIVRHDAIGMNFVDIYHRRGIYALPSYPAVIGVEAAGTVEAVGSAIAGLKIGDRIAYCGVPAGAYATRRALAAQRAILLPPQIDAATAASSLLKAMTAYMLLYKTYPVGTGTTVLVHAAAGGLGAILVKWAKELGATVIGTVSSEEKAELARSYGADHLIVGRDADLVGEVKFRTNGRGVDVGYDGIGGSVLAKTIDSVRPFGTVVTIGQAAGPIPPVNVDQLRPGKVLSHPSILAFIIDQANYREAANAAIAAMENGITAVVAGKYPLEEAARAQEFLESGRAAGSLLLIPE
ncbi:MULTISPECIES: quinone oxidoreductase [unclassified Neorhizobium]|uniref:quinone oxidoreductase family protein n=1 Tax=unclassified Neorhizobium TaxID=2629175 RepID=UPI001FF298AB|nr:MULTISPECIES: quinone oxidoreductase [unclassified Neorhizobium]MCJ9671624.1 quinone oxidoreductase [Neorhizobium sp. SHOUNA12B]MCJ9747290.1 quinone oxidoreductase [Neorhizobium sp. SHOUNA12A]